MDKWTYICQEKTSVNNVKGVSRGFKVPIISMLFSSSEYGQLLENAIYSLWLSNLFCFIGCSARRENVKGSNIFRKIKHNFTTKYSYL